MEVNGICCFLCTFVTYGVIQGRQFDYLLVKCLLKDIYSGACTGAVRCAAAVADGKICRTGRV